MELCDYCGKHPIASDYGACQDCADHHTDDPGGPTLFRPDGSKIDRDSEEYRFYMGED